MPDVTCPSCGKNNPPDAEVCRYCQTPLGEPDSTPDWLRSLRSSGGEDAPPGESEEVPDWLADVRRAQEPAPGEPDWLSGLVSSSEKPAAGGEEDWLSGLRAEGAVSSQPAESAPSEAPLAEGAADWLSNLQPESSAPDAAGEGVDLNAWLRSLDEESPAAAVENAVPEPPPAAQPAEVDLNEWLRSLDTQNPPETPSAAPAAQPPAASDWLSTLSDTPPAPVEPTGAVTTSLPGWLDGLDSAVSPSEPAPAPQESVPGWLSSTPAPEPVQEAPAPAEPAALPDWLAALAPAAAAAAEEPPQPAAEPAAPDWLAGFQAEAPAAAEAAVEPSTEPAAPDWLAGFQAEAPAAAEAAAEPAAEPAAPDWLAGFQAEAPAAVEPAAEPAQAAELPDWLTSFEAAGAKPEQGVLDQAAEAMPPFIDENAPSWLSGMRPPAAEESGAPAFIEEAPLPVPVESAPFQVDLPDWLNEVQPAEIAATAAAAAEEAGALPVADETLARAELPDWVAELRPIEAALPGDLALDDGDTRVEKAGPLAGIRGILPGEESAVRFRKLPAYSARLHVSEKQRVHAQLFENLLPLETQALEIPAEASRAPQTMLRLVVGLLLILAILAPLLTGFQLTPPPAAPAPGLAGLQARLEGLPAGAPVLLAVDYEPAYAGEISLAASGVVETLMARGARISLVSTVPAGPALGEALLRAAGQRQPAYDLTAATVNLSYLPGGISSLLEFAQNPQRAAPLALNGAPAWDRPALQGVTGLPDFALIVLLTDRVETARGWLEQVQPLAPGVPLLAVTSAQAAPVLLPYLDSGQLSGLLSGLSGGAQYEVLTRRSGLAGAYWGSYQAGFAVGILLILAGAVASLTLRSLRKPQKGKG